MLQCSQLARLFEVSSNHWEAASENNHKTGDTASKWRALATCPRDCELALSSASPVAGKTNQGEVRFGSITDIEIS
jgi:hypothetical protein